MSFFELVKNRFSVRAFRSEAVEFEKIEKIIETASLFSRTLAVSLVAVKSKPQVITEKNHVMTADAKAILPKPIGPIILAK